MVYFRCNKIYTVFLIYARSPIVDIVDTQNFHMSFNIHNEIKEEEKTHINKT